MLATGPAQPLVSLIGYFTNLVFMPEGLSRSTVGMLAPIVILIAAYGVILALLYKKAADSGFAQAFFKASTPGAILTVINSGGVYLIVLAISAQYSANEPNYPFMNFAYNVAASTFGLAMGWILGITISPSSKDEASEFSLLTKAVSTFLTGYVLGYVKDLTLPDIKQFLERPGIAFRLLIGAACCFSTVAVVFVSRRAETMRANAVRDWFISYTPIDPKHAQSLRPDVLARGPFSSRDDALAEIAKIKDLPEFKGVTLTAVRVNIVSEEDVVVAATAATPANGGGNGNGGNGDSGAKGNGGNGEGAGKGIGDGKANGGGNGSGGDGTGDAGKDAAGQDTQGAAATATTNPAGNDNPGATN